VPGIGERAAIGLRILMPELGTLCVKKWRLLLGLRPHPCNLADAVGDSGRPAVAGGRPAHPGAEKPVARRGSHPPPELAEGRSNPNSRLGRKASPVAQGRVKTDAIVGGIDVSKDKLGIAARPGGAVFGTRRDAAGLDAVTGCLAPLAPAAVAVEATGGFEVEAAASLAAAGLPAVVANPAQVRSFAQALGKRAKTGPAGATVIAHFAEAAKPEIRPLPDDATRLLAGLAARRRRIVPTMAAGRQRQRRLVEKRLQKSVARLLKALEKELSPRDQNIDDAARGSPAWREKEDLLAAAPGAGPGIARALIAGLPEPGAPGRKRIAALAGLAPWTRQSGRWKGKSLIGGGRPCARAALFMGALAAARTNPVLQGFEQRLIDAGKPRLAAIVAVARRLLTILDAVLRGKKPWRNVEQARAHATAPTTLPSADHPRLTRQSPSSSKDGYR